MFIKELLSKRKESIEATRYKRIFEEVSNRLINITNITDTQIKGIFEIFEMSVKETEAFGHIIDEEDLIEELRLLIVGINVYSNKEPLGKRLQQANNERYGQISRLLLDSLEIFLDPQLKKYFGVIDKNKPGRDTTWYNTHLVTTVAYILHYLKTEYSSRTEV